MSMQERIKNLDVLDIALTKWSAVFFGILLVLIFPILLHVEWYWYAIIMVVLAIRPTMNFLK